MEPSGRNTVQSRPARESPSVTFLRWALPRLGLTWSGFRRVRRQVWRRTGRRIAELHLAGPDAYRAYLERYPEEWAVLETFCRIPISRFLRDRIVFERLRSDVLPVLAARASRLGAGRVRAWSAGCGAGEEPYSLVLLWRLALAPSFPAVTIEVLATDIDETLLDRARIARYRRSSLREVPLAWIEAAFARSDDWYELRESFTRQVEFHRADLRVELPDGLFDLVLCRNVVCTYFAEEPRRRTLARMMSVLRPGGALVIGKNERLPQNLGGLVEWDHGLGIFRRVAALGPCPAGHEEATSCI